MNSMNLIELCRCEEALDYTEQAVRLANKSDCDYHKCISLRCNADILHQMGRFQEALDKFERSHELEWDYGIQYPYLLAQSEYRSCDFYCASGLFEKATASIVRLEKHHVNDLGESAYSGAMINIMKGQLELYQAVEDQRPIPDLVQDHFLNALTILRQIDVRQYTIKTLVPLAYSLALSNELDEAKKALKGVQEIYDRTGDQMHRLLSALCQSVIWAKSSPPDQERVYSFFTHYISKAEKSKFRRVLPDLKYWLAFFANRFGDVKLAQEQLQFARKLAQDQNKKVVLANIEALQKVIDEGPTIG